MDENDYMRPVYSLTYNAATKNVHSIEVVNNSKHSFKLKHQDRFYLKVNYRICEVKQVIHNNTQQAYADIIYLKNFIQMINVRRSKYFLMVHFKRIFFEMLNASIKCSFSIN